VEGGAWLEEVGHWRCVLWAVSCLGAFLLLLALIPVFHEVRSFVLAPALAMIFSLTTNRHSNEVSLHGLKLLKL
jgi:hypothetical protein